MFRRFLAVLMVALVLLAACGDDGGDGGGAESPSDSTEQSSSSDGYEASEGSRSPPGRGRGGEPRPNKRAITLGMTMGARRTFHELIDQARTSSSGRRRRVSRRPTL